MIDEDALLRRITTHPGIFGGKPIIRGQRLAVEHILKKLANGWTEADILDGYPFLDTDDIRATLLFAGELAASARVDGESVAVRQAERASAD